MNNSSTKLISEIESDIMLIEQDVSLLKEINYEDRADALDFIDFHVIERIEMLLPIKELGALKKRAESLKCKLEKIDTDLFIQLRDAIRGGTYSPSSFTEIIQKYSQPDTTEQSKIGYDNLDVFINGLLSDQPIPEAINELQPQMVFYQKTPARIVFGMAKMADIKESDVFFDIGSGLGQVPMLMNLITGVIAKGIEYEAASCVYARGCALQLNLANVEFINMDARDVSYSKGTIFFMYTPFEGSMLQEMLEILQRESRRRTIRVFTYGPCSLEVAKQNWLHPVNSDAGNPYKLCEFISLCE